MDNCPYIIPLYSYLKHGSGFIENAMLVSFDIKFIRRDQKQRRNGQACRASPMCFWVSLINLVSEKDTYMVYYLSCIICRFHGK